MIELKHLRLLCAIDEHGTMSAAATVLGYSQPAVTQQVRALERELATPLVLRSGTGTRLTEAGRVLVRHAESVLATMALARSEVEAIAGLRAGRVRITCFPSAAATLLPPALGALRTAHPGLTATLVEAEPGRALELLRGGECDIAVVYRYVSSDVCAGSPDAEVVTVHLLDESVYVALPAGHPAAGEEHDHVELAALRAERWIAGCPRCRGILERSCAAAGFVPDIAFETDDYVALQRLAAAGLGVAFVPELMLAVVRADPSLVLRRLRPEPVRSVSVVTTAELARVPGVARTVEALREAATSRPPAGR